MVISNDHYNSLSENCYILYKLLVLKNTVNGGACPHNPVLVDSRYFPGIRHPRVRGSDLIDDNMDQRDQKIGNYHVPRLARAPRNTRLCVIYVIAFQ